MLRKTANPLNKNDICPWQTRDTNIVFNELSATVQLLMIHFNLLLKIY